MWYTTDGAVAAKLMTPAEARAAVLEQNARFQVSCENITESNAGDSDFEIPLPEWLRRAKVDYLPCQRAGVAVMYKRPFVLLADEQGIGKTIQVCGLINADASLRKILIIAPNALRFNWRDEMRRWLVNDYRLAIWSADMCRPDYADINIIHYDVVYKWQNVLRTIKWDLVACDECQVLKNPKSRRSRAVLGIDKATARRENTKRLEKLATYLPGQPVPPELLREVEVLAPLRGRRGVMITGTPLPNRPKEGFPIFRWCDPETYRSYTKFVRQYCDGEITAYGMDDSGGSNLPELQVLLRSTIMVRRMKADVLRELPAKRRKIIEIPHAADDVVKAEMQAFEEHEAALAAMREATAHGATAETREGYAELVSKLKSAQAIAFSKLAKLRHETAVAKLPYVLDHLRTIVDGGEKVVVFGHHQDVIAAIAKEFGPRFLAINGLTPAADRKPIVDRFQVDSKIRGIVGAFGPMGTGWTLTASSHVVFVELDWVPGNMAQAEDRCHRIGQRDSVLVEHLVLAGSPDARMARVIVEKQEMQAAALDMPADDVIGKVLVPGQIDVPAGPSADSREPPGAGAALAAPQGLKLPAPLPDYQQAPLFDEL
jgi:SWI/SNF-related matrix-associated actin-dependent regulator 1 of chromatin subfamily A